jgi:hypothetical protein
MADDFKVLSTPEATDFKILEQGLEPIEIPASPMRRTFGQETYSPAVGSRVDDAARRERGMPTAKEVTQRTVTAKLMDAVKGAGKFDPNSTFEDANGWQISLGYSNENTEKLRKFKAKFPKGDIMFVPTSEGTSIVARAHPNQPFRALGAKGETFAGLANAKTALGVAGAIATGGSGIIPAMLLQGAAGVAGSAVDDAVEAARGYQDSSWGSMALDAGINGLFSAATEPVARFFTGATSDSAVDIAKSFVPLAEAGSEIPILKGQVGSPIKTTLFRQVSKISPQAKLKLREQRAALRELLAKDSEFTPEMLDSMSNERLSNFLALYGSDINLTSIGNLTPVDRYAAGTALKKALTKFKEVGRASTDSLYAEAEAMGKYEVWNGEPLKEFAEKNLQPIVGRADAGGEVVSEYGDVELSRLNKELAGIYTDISNLDKTITLHKENSGIKQLLALRTRTGDLLEMDLPASQNEQVAKLYKLLQDTIENPATGNDAFAKKWLEANVAYRDYKDFMRFGQVKAALTNKSAEKVADMVFQPGNLDFITMAKNKMLADPDMAPQWDIVRRGFQERFYANTASLAKASDALDKYSQKELNTFLTAAEQKNLREASIQAKQIQNGPIKDMLAEFNTEGARILKLVEEGNEAEVERLVKMAGGVDSDTAAAMRAGVFQNILNAAEYTDRATGQKLVNPSQVSVALTELIKSRRLGALFRPEDWKRFSNWEKVTAVVGDVSDEGASIQTGQIASEIAETPFTMFTNPKKATSALLKLRFMSGTLGYILSQPASFEKVLATAANAPAKNRDRAAISATMIAMNNLQKTWAAREDLEPIQQSERVVQQIQNNDPGTWEYLKEYFGGYFGGDEQPAAPVAPPAEAPQPIGDQGSLQPAPRTGIMSNTNMAQAMPPRPSAPTAQPSPAQGSKYAALFPRDSLGAMAASGGIASLKG